MRFANIGNPKQVQLNNRKGGKGRQHAGALTFLVFLGMLWVNWAAKAETVWQISGQPAITFAYPDNLAQSRIAQLNQRLAEIAAKLNPNQAWVVDILPAPHPKVPGAKLETIKSATIRLQGQPLLEVTEADAKEHNASSVMDLANTWARSLSAILNQPFVRQNFTAGAGMPNEIVFNGATYALKSELAPDRGLFRTDGQRVDGRIIYWEVPYEQRNYRLGLSSTTAIGKSPSTTEPKSSLSKIFLLNRQQQFVPYLRQQN